FVNHSNDYAMENERNILKRPELSRGDITTLALITAGYSWYCFFERLKLTPPTCIASNILIPLRKLFAKTTRLLQLQKASLPDICRQRFHWHRAQLIFFKEE